MTREVARSLRGKGWGVIEGNAESGKSVSQERVGVLADAV